MRMLTMTGILISIAAMAAAGTIVDLQTGVFAEGDEVTVTGAVVTGVKGNGFVMNEGVNGPNTGVWVYTGDAPTVAVGDLVDVKGLYEEYFELTEINVSTDPTGYVTDLGEHQGALMPLYVTIHELTNNSEAYESCYVSIIDPMKVVQGVNQFGEWVAESQMRPGLMLTLDDGWYDTSGVVEGDCYCCAVGVFTYGFGAFKLQPFAEAICVIDCQVDTENMAVSEVKTLFR